MRVAVYAGSFDPITNGHVWMIQQGTAIFDSLIVAVGTNPDKKYTFSLDDRLRFLRHTTDSFSNCRTDSFENRYLVDYAQSVDANFILRGIRNESDYTFERAMRNINGDLTQHIATVFLMPPREIAEVSSSMVKGLVGPHGWENVVRGYVPACVFKALKRQ